jgi:hypothetical protein
MYLPHFPGCLNSMLSCHCCTPESKKDPLGSLFIRYTILQLIARYIAYHIILLIIMTYQIIPDVGHVALKHHKAVLRKNIIYMESGYIYDLESVVHVTKRAMTGNLKAILDMGGPSI